jgi:hypothetical protein
VQVVSEGFLGSIDYDNPKSAERALARVARIARKQAQGGHLPKSFKGEVRSNPARHLRRERPSRHRSEPLPDARIKQGASAPIVSARMEIESRFFNSEFAPNVDHSKMRSEVDELALGAGLRVVHSAFCFYLEQSKKCQQSVVGLKSSCGLTCRSQFLQGLFLLSRAPQGLEHLLRRLLRGEDRVPMYPGNRLLAFLNSCNRA